MNLRSLNVLMAAVAALSVSAPAEAIRIVGTSAQAPFSHPAFPPWNAVDDNWNTIWSSGGFAPGSIEVILPGNWTLESVQTAAVMWPNPGPAAHHIYGRTGDGNYYYLGAISGYISDGDWFWNTVNAPYIFNAVAIYAVEGTTSWVGWRDIYV